MLTQEKVLKIKGKLDALSATHPIAYEIHSLNKSLVLYHPLNLSLDKANWIRRKRNAALRFEMDTLDLYEKNHGDESGFALKYGLDLKDYTITPGSVCIKSETGYLLGVVSVTGLSPQEDHALATQSLID